jgi:hypothetical protein
MGKIGNLNMNKIKYVLLILLSSATTPTTALAQGVGGVSATANPIANSSGSVTNQAIQVLQGPYITNQYGNGISCQGPTMNVTPYIQYADSWKEPWEDYYMEPQYDNRDVKGETIEVERTVKNYPWEPWYDNRVRTDPNDPLYDANEDGEADRWFEDGAAMTITEMQVVGDGAPDNPGSILWEKPVRSGMKRNQNLNLGLSATLSWPMDGKLQALCKQAATTQIEMQQQLVANKRLDFEIARLKNCGELKKSGIMFHPKSPYYSICADVVVTNPGGTLKPHSHQIPKPTFSKPSAIPLSPDSDPVEQVTSPSSTKPSPSSQASSSPSLSPSSQRASQHVGEGPQAALLGGPMSLRLPQYQP